MDKKVFERFSGESLLKSSDAPSHDMEDASKVKLNRKGNELFNRGELETARRIFQTTGYSDGLIRVGNRYLESNRPVDALKMYWLAKDDLRSGKLVTLAALAIQKLLSEEDKNERRDQSGRISQGADPRDQGSPES